MAVHDLALQDFEAVVTNHAVVIVDFWSPTCGPCRALAPLFERIAGEHPDLLFARVNVQQEPELASHFGIQSVPTLMAIRERIIVFKRAGAPSELGLRELLAKVRALDLARLRAELSNQEGEA